MDNLNGHTNFYKELLGNMYDGVYFVDRDRRIAYWNKGAERITGYQTDAVIGKCCRDNLLVHVNEAGRLLCKTGGPLYRNLWFLQSCRRKNINDAICGNGA